MINNNLFWLLVGIAIGSSLMMGTQFLRQIADRWYDDYIKPGGNKESSK